MFKDLGYQLLIKWKLWKVLVVIFPFTFIYGIYLLFIIADRADKNNFDGSQLIHAEVTNQFSSQLSTACEGYVKEFAKAENVQTLLLEKFNELGLETYVQGTNIVAKFKTRRSPDYECSLISFEYDPQKKIRNIAYILSLIKLLKSEQINYLSRDIIFVGFHEREYGKGISAFLEEYINPKGVSLMPRSGTIRSAININLDDRFDSIALKVFGLNGKVSDRDYFISVNQILQNQGLVFTYTETDYSWMIQLEKFLESFIKKTWETLSLNNFYQLPKKRLIYMHPYFSHQIEMIQGDLHEAHSYIMKYGIYAVTFRGYSSQNRLDQVQLSSKLLLIGEASVRALMANDEFIHSGSTLYLPLNRGTTLTIQNYCLPYVLAILSCAIFAIKAVYSRWHFNLYNDDKQILGKGIAIVAHKAMIEVMMGVTLCFIPFEDDFDRYLKILVSVIVGYLIFIPLSRKWIFNQYTLPRTAGIVEWLWVELVIQICFAMMYAGIVHIPMASIIAVFFGPWFFFIQPLRFKPNFKLLDILSYTINLLFLYMYYQLLMYIGLDQILEYYKQVVINYNQVGVYVFYYLNGVLVPSLIRFVELLLF